MRSNCWPKARRRAEPRVDARNASRNGRGIFEGSGVTWDVIEAATGLTEAGFQELKAQLADSGS